MARTIVWIAATLTTFIAGASQAEIVTDFAPFRYNTATPKVLSLVGDIDFQTPLQLKLALRRYPAIATLELVSRGGDVYAALPLAYDVRDAGLKTTIPRGKSCASACSYLFFAGVERSAEGTLGVHQIATTSNDLRSGQKALGDIFTAFREFGVPTAVISEMMTAPSDGMAWFQPSDLAALGLLGRVAASGARTTATVTPPRAQPSQPTITVKASGGADFRTIGSAIEAAPSGARIEIYPGTYSGGVTVSKPLDIAGVGPRAAIVWEVQNNPVIWWTAVRGSISGLTLRQIGATDGKTYGVISFHDGSATLSKNDLSSRAGAAVYVSGIGANPAIIENMIHDSRDSGIRVSENGRGTVEGNDVFGNGSAGVAILTEAAPVIRGNKIHDGGQSGVFVYENGRGTIEDNDIFDNESAGVAIREKADPEVRGNDIYGNRIGVSVRGRGLGTIEGNEVRENGQLGILIAEEGNPTVRENRIHGNDGSGVFVYDNGHGTIEANKIFGNTRDGVAIKTGANPSVRDNTISSNRYGVRIYDGGGGEITGNDLRGNDRMALSADYSGSHSSRNNLTEGAAPTSATARATAPASRSEDVDRVSPFELR